MDTADYLRWSDLLQWHLKLTFKLLKFVWAELTKILAEEIPKLSEYMISGKNPVSAWIIHVHFRRKSSNRCLLPLRKLQKLKSCFQLQVLLITVLLRRKGRNYSPKSYRFWRTHGTKFYDYRQHKANQLTLSSDWQTTYLSEMHMHVCLRIHVKTWWNIWRNREEIWYKLALRWCMWPPSASSITTRMHSLLPWMRYILP